MIDRRTFAYLSGLVLIVIATVTTALILMWLSTDIQIRVNQFYSGQTEQVSEEVYREWDTLAQNGYVMQGMVTPLLFGAMGALFGLLAVLAFRWERRQRVDQATAAS